MMKISKEKWLALENEFLSGDMNNVAFCKSKNLDLECFRQQLNNAESGEDKNENLFV